MGRKDGLFGRRLGWRGSLEHEVGGGRWWMRLEGVVGG